MVTRDNCNSIHGTNVLESMGNMRVYGNIKLSTYVKTTGRVM